MNPEQNANNGGPPPQIANSVEQFLEQVLRGGMVQMPGGMMQGGMVHFGGGGPVPAEGRNAGRGGQGQAAAAGAGGQGGGGGRGSGGGGGGLDAENPFLG